MKNKPRIQVLDSLRGIAAIAVVLFHYTVAYKAKDVLFNFQYGYLGVHLFFIISGFVIYMTLEKTKKPLDFLVSRFSRLFPAYWAAVLLTTLIINYSGLSNINIGKTQFLGNITMCQHWFRIIDIDGAYWTLAVELSFYVCIFLVFIIKALKYIYPISIAFILLLVLIKLFKIPFIGSLVPFLLYSNLFLSGIFFFKLKTNNKIWYYHLFIFSSAILQMAISVSLTESIYVLFIFIIFYLFTYNLLEFLNNKVLIFLGSISYTLYLIHENIGLIILTYLERFDLSFLVRFFIVFSIVIFISFLFVKFIEKPSMNIIRNNYKKYQNKK